MRKKDYILGLMYASAALCVALVTVVAFFPYDALEKRLETAVQQHSPYHVRLLDTSYRFPLGVKIQGAMLLNPQQQSIFRLDRVDLQLRPWTVFLAEQRLSAQALACGGHVQAELSSGSIFRINPEEGRVNISGLFLEQCEVPLSQATLASLSGHLQGELHMENLTQGIEQMRGNYAWSLNQGGIRFGEGLLLGLALEKVGMDIRIVQEGEVLTVSQAKLQSPGLDASLEGEVRLKNPLKDSEINLEAVLASRQERLAGRPENALVREALTPEGLTLRLGGTWREPLVNLQ